jgi:hypothetical protein
LRYRRLCLHYITFTLCNSAKGGLAKPDYTGRVSDARDTRERAQEKWHREYQTDQRQQEENKRQNECPQKILARFLDRHENSLNFFSCSASFCRITSSIKNILMFAPV